MNFHPTFNELLALHEEFNSYTHEINKLIAADQNHRPWAMSQRLMDAVRKLHAGEPS